MKFGLMLFGSNHDALVGDKYRLVIESAKFADQHGFSSIWTPERHFTQLGCLYPNPSVLNAALARETKRVRLQSGSVVLPIHNPIRIAEEWSIVDNLSNGRIGISFASGWNPDDFAFFPDKYQNRHHELFNGIDVVRKIWQGESIKVTSGNGNKVEVNVYPKPIQKELPIWLTAAGNPRTFATAGQMGTNLLSSLLGQQSMEELADKIALYRHNRAENGYNPDTGIVSIMVHTFVGRDAETVKNLVRVPYCEYIKSNFDLFAKGVPQSRGYDPKQGQMSEKDLDNFVNFLFESFASSRGLIGTPQSCLNLIEQLDSIGVDEITCLLDFGQSEDLILEHLPYIHELTELYKAQKNQQPRPATIRNISNGHSAKFTEDVNNNQQIASQLRNTLPAIRDRCQDSINIEEFYSALNQHELYIGESYQGIESLWLGQGEAIAQIKLPDSATTAPDSIRIHPALLDACNQVMGAALISTNNNSLYYPMGMRRFTIHKPMPNQVWSYASLTNLKNQNHHSLEGEVRIFDNEGNLLVEISGLQLQRADTSHPNNRLKAQYTDWMYELEWQLSSLPKLETSALKESGSWIILADSLGVGEKLAQLLEAQGESCFLVHAGEVSQIEVAKQIWLNPTDPEGMAQLINQVVNTSLSPCRGIIHLWSLDVTKAEATTIASLEKDQRNTVTNLLLLLQTVNQMKQSPHPSLWLVTQDLQQVGSEKTLPSLAQAPLWGLGRVIANELPQIFGKLIDLESQSSLEEQAQQLLRELQLQDQEEQIVIRQNQRHILRLVPSDKDVIPAQPIEFSPNASYLITGGLGYFGLKSALWMVEQGAKNIILIGRNTPSAKAEETINKLENLGAKVLVLQGDISDSKQVNVLFEQVRSTCPPLKGVFHLAGFIEQQTLPEMTQNQLELMLRPKVFGSWNLHQLTLDMNLDFFFCSSSMSPVFGSQGLGHYASANYFLDIFAKYRQKSDLPSLTVNIGALADGGMVLSTPKAQQYTTEVGLNVSQPQDLLDAVAGLINQQIPNMILADINWSIFKKLYESSIRKLLLEQIEVNPQDFRNNELGKRNAFWDQLELTSESERYPMLINYLQQEVVEILGYVGNNSLPDLDQGFFEMGMDSLMAVSLKNKLEQSLGCSLPTVLIFEHPNIHSLADYIVQEILNWELSATETLPTKIVSSDQEIEDELSIKLEHLSEKNLEDIINQELAELTEIN